MLMYDDILGVLHDVQFNDWVFDLRIDSGRPYFCVRFTGRCNTTGRIQAWEGKKWFLSSPPTRSEIVQTAFKAVITALEHEARETFRCKGEAIFGPHFDCDLLVELCKRTDAQDVAAETAYLAAAAIK
jgi:hypothetical protein